MSFSWSQDEVGALVRHFEDGHAHTIERVLGILLEAHPHRSFEMIWLAYNSGILYFEASSKELTEQSAKLSQALISSLTETHRLMTQHTDEPSIEDVMKYHRYRLEYTKREATALAKAMEPLVLAASLSDALILEHVIAGFAIGVIDASPPQGPSRQVHANILSNNRFFSFLFDRS